MLFVDHWFVRSPDRQRLKRQLYAKVRRPDIADRTETSTYLNLTKQIVSSFPCGEKIS